ncbi:MAG: CvpA family protein [Phycisphaerae bacterium]|jgi:uncharacterized membrane protein required for colicin V production
MMTATEGPQNGTQPVEWRRTPRFVGVFRILLYLALVLGFTFGGPVIRAATLCALPLCLLGDWDGGARHVLRIAMLIVAAWAAPVFAIQLGTLLSSLVNVPPAMVPVAGYALMAIVALVLAGILSGGVQRLIRKRPVLNGINHVAGAALGAGEGVALVVVCCWMLAVFAKPLAVLRAQLPPGVQSAPRVLLDTLAEATAVVREDPAGQWLVRDNPLAKVPAVRKAAVLAELGANPARVWAAVQDGRLRQITNLPEVRRHVDAITSDPNLMAAMEQNDLATLLNSAQARQILADDKLQTVLVARQAEMQAAIDEHFSPEEVAALEAEARRQAEQVDPAVRAEIERAARQFKSGQAP